MHELTRLVPQPAMENQPQREASTHHGTRAASATQEPRPALPVDEVEEVAPASLYTAAILSPW